MESLHELVCRQARELQEAYTEIHNLRTQLDAANATLDELRNPYIEEVPNEDNEPDLSSR